MRYAELHAYPVRTKTGKLWHRFHVGKCYIRASDVKMYIKWGAIWAENTPDYIKKRFPI